MASRVDASGVWTLVNLAYRPDAREVTMGHESRRFFIIDSAAEYGHAPRLLVRHKVHDGRSPHNRIARITSGPGPGKHATGRESPIRNEQLVKEVALADVRRDRGTVSFHTVRRVR